MRTTLLALTLVLALGGCSSRTLVEKESEVDRLRADLAAAQNEIDRLEAENTALDRRVRESMQTRLASGGAGRGETVAVFQANELFGPGGSELTKAGRDQLAEVAGQLRLRYPNSTVLIEGHSDPSPIRTARYPSNWDLSTARASAVARYFETTENFAGEQLRVIGFAAHDPVADNDTAEGRRQNRRVRIAVMGG